MLRPSASRIDSRLDEQMRSGFSNWVEETISRSLSD